MQRNGMGSECDDMFQLDSSYTQLTTYIVMATGEWGVGQAYRE